MLQGFLGDYVIKMALNLIISKRDQSTHEAGRKTMCVHSENKVCQVKCNVNGNTVLNASVCTQCK